MGRAELFCKIFRTIEDRARKKWRLCCVFSGLDGNLAHLKNLRLESPIGCRTVGQGATAVQAADVRSAQAWLKAAPLRLRTQPSITWYRLFVKARL